MQLAVLGAGTMGSSIAQVAAMSGHGVALRDVGDEPLARGRAAVDHSLARFVASGTLTSDEAAQAAARISWTTDLRQAVADAEVIVEAVPEVLDLKRAVLAEAVAAAPADALLGTNTSQLSISSIGAHLGAAAERLVGMHFFNPAVLMRLLELVRGLQTSDATLQRAEDFARSLGKETVVCNKDSPGFLTSRVSAIMRLEAIRMLDEGLASAADIDKAIRLAFNHPMGPLALGDYNGLDTYLHALEGLAAAHGDRFRPTVTLRNMVAAGRLGRKSGSGFYDYDEPAAAPDATPDATPVSTTGNDA
jgi:3-hydroxybutyryl-CoA dehydrogenase